VNAILTATTLKQAAATVAPCDVRGLVYVDDASPGFTRRRCGRGFVYADRRGVSVADLNVLERLRRLAVPPAWTDVWFCPDSNGHVQATGRDAKGRKQYRYHDLWQVARSEAKYDSLRSFGDVLASLREQVARDMRTRDISYERVVATAVWLLDHTLIRVGNTQYSDSYGLTTLLDDHAEITADRLRFRFTGKSGKPHDVLLRDRRVARTVLACQELPGQQLLQYVDGDVVRGIASNDINDYIRSVTDSAFTAKTFRTWGGSTATLAHLRSLDRPVDERQAAAQIRGAMKVAASTLRNTPTVCRNSYVHPRVIESHLDGTLWTVAPSRKKAHVTLADDERRLVSLLT
jgi:DNA topoisomerase I